MRRWAGIPTKAVDIPHLRRAFGMLSETGSGAHDDLPAQSRKRAWLQAERALIRLLRGAAGDVRNADCVSDIAREPERHHD